MTNGLLGKKDARRWEGIMRKHEELVGIQFLRGLCALGVVFGHGAAMLADPKYGGFSLLGGAMESGSLGVDIFFVISGFIMPVVALRGEGLRPALSLGDFIRKRFLRIVPMMWIAIISYALLQKLFARDLIDVGAYFRAFFLLPFSYVKPDIIWTLRQEFLFYIFFATCFIARPAWRWLILAWVLAPVAFVPTLGSFWATTAYIDNFWSIVMSSVNIEFGIGLVIGTAWVKYGARSPILPPIHPFLLMLTLFVILVGAWQYLGVASQTLPSVLFMGVGGALLVELGARLVCVNGWLTRIGRLLGDASYSIYLFHLHLLAGILAIRAKLGLNAPPLIALGITILLTLAATIGIFLFVERPLISWLRKMGGTHRIAIRQEEREFGTGGGQARKDIHD
jgi:exopolysaccharide production protein ExoZ